MIKKFGTTSKAYKIAKTKQSEFFWSGKIDFYREMFLTISISFGFNLGFMTFENTAHCFNTVFCVIVAVNAVMIPFISCILLYSKLKKATLAEEKPIVLESSGQIEESKSEQVVEQVPSP